MLAAPEFLDRRADPRALRMPVHQPRPPALLGAEQIPVPPQHAVIPQFGFLQHLQVRIQIRLRKERRPVQPLHHLVFFVAPEIRPRHALQLERLDGARAFHVRPAAQIREIARVVQADRFAFGNVRQPFQLVRLAPPLHQLPHLFARLFLAHERQVFGHNLGHFRLDRRKVFFRQPMLQVEIIVKPVLGVRADIKQGVRPQPLNRRCHHMRRAVAHRLQTN
jgi:hypothetical protein